MRMPYVRVRRGGRVVVLPVRHVDRPRTPAPQSEAVRRRVLAAAVEGPSDPKGVK